MRPGNLRWEQRHVDDLKEYWVKDPSKVRTARHLSKLWGRRVTPNMIVGKTRDLNLSYHRPAHLGKKPGLATGHPAVVDGKTVFRAKVLDPSDRGVLRSGENNRKLGAEVTKGRWRGMPIYSLTLEERATCPTTCTHWRNCYGNGMYLAKRWRHGARLENAIERDLEHLSDRHPGGFVVRLHVLGDFYDVGYVQKWFAWLRRFPALRVFGYTAWTEDTEIGGLIHRMRVGLWDRFAVRTSAGKIGPKAVTVGNLLPAQAELLRRSPVIVCPVQTGKTRSCGTCALCWGAPRKTIAFMEH